MTVTSSLRRAALAAFLAGSVGCGGGSPTKAPPPPAGAGGTPAATAPPGAKPNKDARGATTGGPEGGFKQGE